MASGQSRNHISKLWTVLLSIVIVSSCLYPAIVFPATAADPALSPADDSLQPLQIANASPDFTAYLQARSSSWPALMLAALSDETVCGLIPAPVDLSYLQGQDAGLADEGALPAAYMPEEISALGDSGPLPGDYDLRTLGRLTAVRNQGSSGSCWAFATYASLESYLMPAQPADFSENNLKNTHGFDYEANSGGNELMSAAYLARWGGPVDETDDPYVPSSTSSPTLPADMHVQEVLFIPDRANSSDNSNLKQAIQTYGAVYTAMYWSATRYNATSHAYYYSSTGANHAIALVGWNDSYSRANFASAPPGDGAFIARNSWGSYWGDGGYFYISYYDAIVGSSNAVFTAGPADNYDHVYQHDPLGWTGNAGYGTDVAWFAARYAAVSNETLKAVGFYTPQVDSGYQVYVYREGALAGTQSGEIPTPGFHTVVLDTPVSLAAGQDFRVEVRLRTPGYNYPVCIESRITGYTSEATSSASESFVSRDGNAWSDIGADSGGSPTNTDVCLKAYTETATGDIESEPPTPPTWPTLSFGSLWYNISENAGTVAITVDRDGSTTAPASVSYAVTGGNATAGADFTGGSGTLTFASGAASATFSVAITNDAVYEGDETVSISLSSPVNATMGSPDSTTIVIGNNDAAPVLRFGSAQYSAAEGAGKITIPVSLTGSTAFPASVGYAVTGGNATAGADFTGGSGTLTFAPGTTTASFDLNLASDTVYEGDETITLALGNPVNATVGTPAATTATITNDDAAPVIRFSLAANSVNENAGTLPVQATLTGSTGLTASVSYSVAGGNATAGDDFTGGSGTLTFAPGTTTASFNLGILNDATDEGDETIVLTLSSPRNATTGTPGTTTITIMDEDALPVVRFGSATYQALENAGRATITVSLAGSTSKPVSVNYSVTGGNASAGTDYTGGNGLLGFAPGATTASFDVTLVNDAVYRGNRTLVLSLGSLKNATAGTPATTTITIVEDDVPTTGQTYDYSLVAGWNLISVPLALQDHSIAGIFPADVRSRIVNIWGWDEAEQNWVYYCPDPDDYFYDYYPALTALETGKAYWVEMTAPATVSIQGTAPAGAPSSPVTPVQGWNFIGPTGSTSSTPGSMYPDAVDVWGWDEAEQSWAYYSPDPGDYFYDYYPQIDSLQPGHGYWVEMA